jgi:hypothetical protein
MQRRMTRSGREEEEDFVKGRNRRGMPRRVTRSGREEEEDWVRGRKERGNAEKGDEKWKRRR